jgi:hypothetical protein
MNMGLEIVTAEWITASLKAEKLLPTSDFPVITDKNINISEIAQREEYILDDKEVWITSAVRPLAKEWK